MKFVWYVDDDLIVLDAQDATATGTVLGEYFGGKVIIDVNTVDIPVNIKYFVKLWNALHPELALSAADVLLEKDGEHFKFGAWKEASVLTPHPYLFDEIVEFFDETLPPPLNTKPLATVKWHPENYGGRKVTYIDWAGFEPVYIPMDEMGDDEYDNLVTELEKKFGTLGPYPKWGELGREFFFLPQEVYKGTKAGMEVLLWIKRNLPGPYLAENGNDKLKNAIRGVPVGTSEWGNEEYLVESSWKEAAILTPGIDRPTGYADGSRVDFYDRSLPGNMKNFPVAYVSWYPTTLPDGREGSYIQWAGFTPIVLEPSDVPDDAIFDEEVLTPYKNYIYFEPEKFYKHTTAGIEILRWIKNNIPGPYYAENANEKLRETIRGKEAPAPPDVLDDPYEVQKYYTVGSWKEAAMLTPSPPKDKFGWGMHGEKVTQVDFFDPRLPYPLNETNVASVIWHPTILPDGREGSYISWAGFEDIYTRLPHDTHWFNFVAALKELFPKEKIEDLLEAYPDGSINFETERAYRHTRAGLELLLWIKNNVPGPYYAENGNDKLKETLKGQSAPSPMGTSGDHYYTVGSWKEAAIEKEAMPPLGMPIGDKGVRLGELGESLVSLIPGMTVIGDIKDGQVHDVDLEVEWQGQRYGVEVKSNSRTGMDPYRYRLTGYGRFTLPQIRQFKREYCESRGLIPGTLGITIDFENNTFDACLLPGEIRTFLGGAKTMVANDVPFENKTGVRPLKTDTMMEPRIPNAFKRPGENADPSWKYKKKWTETSDEEIERHFGSWKEAMPWHVSPRKNRDSILEHGLDYTKGKSPYDDSEWMNQYDLGHQERGNFFMQDRADRKGIERWAPESGEADFWYLHPDFAELLDMKQDRILGPDAMYTQEPVPAEWLERVEPEDFEDEWYKKIMQRRSNILDPIQETLDPDVFDLSFDPPEPRLSIFEGHLNHVREQLRLYGFDPMSFRFYLTGSICTYQYSDTSDCDISIVATEEMSDEERAFIIKTIILPLDGGHFPGTNYPFQHFVQPYGVDIEDIFVLGNRAAYDFEDREWVSPPNKERATDVRVKYPDWFAKAIQTSDKMNALLDNGDSQAAWDMYKAVHEKRAADQKKYGDFSEGNIQYKYLVNNGTFDRLRNAGFHITTSLNEYTIEYGQSPNGEYQQVYFQDPRNHDNIGKIRWRKASPLNGDPDGVSTYISFLGYTFSDTEDTYLTDMGQEWRGYDYPSGLDDLSAGARIRYLREMYPNLARDMLRWVKDNLEPPFTAWVINAPLKRMLDNQPPSIFTAATGAALDGVMLALVPDDTTSLVVPDGEPAEQLHCTLVFLGEDADDVLGGEDSSTLEAVAKQLASEFQPVTVHTGAVEALGDKEPPAQVVLLEKGVLDKLHDRALEILDENDWHVEEKYPEYKPHVTLTYDAEAPEIDVPGEITFSTLRLAIGGNNYDFPLGQKTGHWREAMAQRTGEPELDALIEQFIREMHWTEGSDLQKPSVAQGQCGEISWAFSRFLDEHNITSYCWIGGKPGHPWQDQENALSVDPAIKRPRPSDFEVFPWGPTGWGYTDRTRRGERDHDATIVEFNGQTYMVDWTAAQFGYTEFPMVQRLEGYEDAERLNEELEPYDVRMPRWQREWTSSSATELVPTYVLMEMLDFDRRETADPEKWEALKADISQNGFTDPVIIEYDADRRKVHLGEGNHRVLIADELGIEWVPARVYLSTRKTHWKEYPVPGVEPDEFNYVPQLMKPSEIGLPVKTASVQLQMYHGSTRKKLGPIKPGFFATSHKPEAEDYAGLGIGLDPEDEGAVFPVTITLNNPVVREGSRPTEREMMEARKEGHDGFLIKFPEDMRDPTDPMPERQWVYVLDPKVVNVGKTAATDYWGNEYTLPNKMDRYHAKDFESFAETHKVSLQKLGRVWTNFGPSTADVDVPTNWVLSPIDGVVFGSKVPHGNYMYELEKQSNPGALAFKGDDFFTQREDREGKKYPRGLINWYGDGQAIVLFYRSTFDNGAEDAAYRVADKLEKAGFIVPRVESFNRKRNDQGSRGWAGPQGPPRRPLAWRVSYMHPEALEDYIKDTGNEYAYHNTPLHNIQNILDNGLLPGNKAPDRYYHGEEALKSRDNFVYLGVGKNWNNMVFRIPLRALNPQLISTDEDIILFPKAQYRDNIKKQFGFEDPRTQVGEEKPWKNYGDWANAQEGFDRFDMTYESLLGQEGFSGGEYGTSGTFAYRGVIDPSIIELNPAWVYNTLGNLLITLNSSRSRRPDLSRAQHEIDQIVSWVEKYDPSPENYLAIQKAYEAGVRRDIGEARVKPFDVMKKNEWVETPLDIDDRNWTWESSWKEASLDEYRIVEHKEEVYTPGTFDKEVIFYSRGGQGRPLGMIQYKVFDEPRENEETGYITEPHTYIHYLGYTTPYGEYSIENPAPGAGWDNPDTQKRVKQNNDELRRLYPNLGRDMLMWVKRNLPPPYKASFENQRLKEKVEPHMTPNQSVIKTPGQPGTIGLPGAFSSWKESARHSSWRYAVAWPASQRRQYAETLHPDTSEIVHTFPNGWTIRKPLTWGDVGREGCLMRHCLAGMGEDDEDTPLDADSTLHSLRDPNNLPHVTFEYSPTYEYNEEGQDLFPNGIIWGAQGRSGEPSEKYLAMLSEFAPGQSWEEYDEDDY
jgi:hypothetical protein